MVTRGKGPAARWPRRCKGWWSSSRPCLGMGNLGSARNVPGAYMTSQSGFVGNGGADRFVALWVKMLKYENATPYAGLVVIGHADFRSGGKALPELVGC